MPPFPIFHHDKVTRHRFLRPLSYNSPSILHISPFLIVSSRSRCKKLYSYSLSFLPSSFYFYFLSSFKHLYAVFSRREGVRDTMLNFAFKLANLLPYAIKFAMYNEPFL